MTTYLRYFIPGRSDHVIVLKSATRPEAKKEGYKRNPGRKDKNRRRCRGPCKVLDWEWGEYHDQLFKTMKTAVLERAFLGGCDWKQYHVAIVYSKMGIDSILFQLLDCES